MQVRDDGPAAAAAGGVLAAMMFVGLALVFLFVIAGG